MQTARAGAAARRARSRPATKRRQLVGLVVVEVTEVLPAKGGARCRSCATGRCRSAESRRAFETPGCVNAGALRAALVAVCSRRGRGRVRRRRAAATPPFCPRGRRTESLIDDTSGPVIDAGAPAVLSWAHAQARPARRRQSPALRRSEEHTSE